MRRDPLSLCEALTEEYASLRKDFEFDPDDSRECLGKLHELALEEDFSALCLSGGGIRSATFGLGVIQGLADLHLLDKLDYLSTVSGGGYIGSWLMAWIHRHRKGAPGVFEDLRTRRTDARRGEPVAIQHLRSYSNYLSPRAGLLSADTWTLGALYLRNLVVLWLVLGPALALVLMIPRLAAELLERAPGANGEPALGVAFLLGTCAAFYASVQQPSGTVFLRPGLRELLESLENQKWFVRLCLIPMVGAAFCLVLYAKTIGELPGPEGSIVSYGIMGVLILSTGWALGGILCRRWTLPSFKKLALELLVMVTTGFVLGSSIRGLLSIMPDTVWGQTLFDGSALATFGVPFLLACYLVASLVVVGLVQFFTPDYDREWWARLEAWVLIVIAFWTLVAVLVNYGPSCLGPQGCLDGALTQFLFPLGGLSGILTLLIAWSHKSPAVPTAAATTAASRRRGGSTIRRLALALAAPLFAAFVIVTIAWVTTKILESPIWGTIELAIQTRTPFPAASELGSAGIFAILLVLLLGFTNVLIDINKFSLHSLYRNRLIRAYLGASNETRQPNRFTGLDESDNIPINQMRGILLEYEDIQDWSKLRDALMNSDEPIPTFIRSHMTDEHLMVLEAEPDLLRRDEKDVVKALLEELNARIEDSELTGDPEIRERSSDRARIEKNRDAVARAFGPDQIRVTVPRKPLHILNVALNLVSGEALAWQERKAESFTVSVYHCGSCHLDDGRGSYRPSSEYMRIPGVPITLGTAAAISGAAASPNMGYHSSKFVGFLMTLLNARLGWWAGNPGVAGARTFDHSGPRIALRPLFDEALGRTNDTAPYVYLSDGGHFDNLGLYEMVLRRCRTILVIDASADPDYALEALGNAIRKIRIDMGISIDLEGFFISGPKADRHAGSYCAIGKVKYGAGDGTGRVGTLLYIKPSIYFHQEPYDVYNYGKLSSQFPHEPTTDQWFSEAQFESYRMLGLHIIQTISGSGGDGDAGPATWKSFFKSVRDYHGPFKDAST